MSAAFNDIVTTATKRRRMASTPEIEHVETVMSPSPSFSSVYEFPLSGECVDRTIEIGSDGDERSSTEEPMMFPSEGEARDRESKDCDSHRDSDGIIYPSDLEIDDGSSSEITGGATSTISQCSGADINTSAQDIQSELVDVSATLVSGCCQQQFLLH